MRGPQNFLVTTPLTFHRYVAVLELYSAAPIGCCLSNVFCFVENNGDIFLANAMDIIVIMSMRSIAPQAKFLEIDLFLLKNQAKMMRFEP